VETTEKTVTLFAVLSMRKIKTMAGVFKVVEHNLRRNKTIKEYINPEMSVYNEYSGAQNVEDFKQVYEGKIQEAHLKRKIQSNASRILEFVFSFSASYAKGWQNNPALKKKMDRYLKDCQQFIHDKYGDIIISTTIHFDETTPHIHILCIPLAWDTKGNGLKFSSSGLVGGREGLLALHNDFYEQVAKNYGLSRGIQGSRATHTELKQYKATEEKKLEEIESKLKLTQTALEESQKKLQDSEAVKTRMMAIQNENMKRDAELSKKKQDLKEWEKQALSGKAILPEPPAAFDKKTVVSWQKTAQIFVDKLTLGFKSIFQKLQNQYQSLLQSHEKLLQENAGLKRRAEKAENDLASKPIAEIVSDRGKKVQVNNRQQSFTRGR
jgi:hypothetical protein